MQTNHGRKFPNQKRLPRFTRAENFPDIRLTDRDLAILDHVHRLRYATADHLRIVIPGSTQGTTRRLRALFHSGYLTRLFMKTRMLAKEPAPIVYGLDARGAKELIERGLSPQELRWRRPHNLRTEDFIEHSLMVTSLRLALDQAVEKRPDLSLAPWQFEEDLQDTVTVPEPDPRHPRRMAYSVRPDGYTAILHGGKHLNLFVEADRGHVEHPRIDIKLRSYWHYLAKESPYWTRYPSPENRLVLFITTSERRLQNLLWTVASVDEQQRGLAQFWFCLESDYTLAPQRLLTGIWRTYRNLDERYRDERKSLLG